MKRIVIVFIMSVYIVFLYASFSYAANGRINVNDSSRNVSLPAHRRHFAVLFPMALPFLFMIHAQQGIVGFPGFGVNAIPYFSGNLIIKSEPDFIKNTKDIGYPMEPNIETIVGLHPDFVIDARFAKMINEKIEHLNIPVISFMGRFGNIEQLLKDVKILGAATDHEREATEYINYYDKILLSIKTRIGNIKDKPKVLYLSYQGPKGNKLTSGGKFDTLVNDIIKKAGGISVSKNVPGRFGLISTEDILRWNPDYIIIGSGGNKKDIYKNKELKYVNAVKHKRVFDVPSDGNRYSTWYAPEKSSLGLLWTAKLLHPNLFKTLNIKKAAAYYYKNFWGISMNSLKVNGYMF